MPLGTSPLLTDATPFPQQATFCPYSRLENINEQDDYGLDDPSVTDFPSSGLDKEYPGRLTIATLIANKLSVHQNAQNT